MKLSIGLASLFLAAVPIGFAPLASAGCDPQMAPIAGNIAAITGANNPCVAGAPAASPPAAPRPPAAQAPTTPN